VFRAHIFAADREATSMREEDTVLTLYPERERGASERDRGGNRPDYSESTRRTDLQPIGDRRQQCGSRPNVAGTDDGS